MPIRKSGVAPFTARLRPADAQAGVSHDHHRAEPQAGVEDHGQVHARRNHQAHPAAVPHTGFLQARREGGDVLFQLQPAQRAGDAAVRGHFRDGGVPAAGPLPAR